MSLTQGYYIRSLRKLHDQELRVEYRAAEKRSRAEYKYWRAVRPLRSTSTRYGYGNSAYASQALYPSHTGMSLHPGHGGPVHAMGSGMGGGNGGGTFGVGAHGHPVHPRDRHRLARAQEKYYRRCYEIEIKRQRELGRIQNRREQLLGMLSGEFWTQGGPTDGSKRGAVCSSGHHVSLSRRR